MPSQNIPSTLLYMLSHFAQRERIHEIFSSFHALRNHDAHCLHGNKNSRTSIEQNDPNARPAIASDIDNIEQYDPIYLGYPIWWAEAPKIMYTFLESDSIKEGTTIVPFCTSGNSNIGSSAIYLQQTTPDANWLEGQRFAIGASASTVTQWLDSLNL